MKYEMSHYRKDAAMWRKVDSVTGETDSKAFTAFTSMMGFRETDHGTYWKQEACDEAVEIAIVQE